MKVLITGSTGLVGRTAYNFFNSKCETKGIARKGSDFEADITHSHELKEIFNTFKPNVLIHTAGITELKDAEQNKELTWKTNFEATASLAELCKAHSAKMVFISSCYVFDGKKGTPYSEEDRTSSESTIYAATKIAAENKIRETLENFVIIRTARIYGKPAFAKTGLFAKILRLLPKGETFKLYNDDKTNPISANKIVEAIDKIVVGNKTGTFHIGGKTILSSFEYGRMIARIWNLDEKQIVASESESDKLFRPKNMALSTKKLEKEIPLLLPTLEEDLNYHFKNA